MQRLSVLLLFTLAATACGSPVAAPPSGAARPDPAAVARDLVAGLDSDGDRALGPGEADLVLAAGEFRKADRDGSGRVDTAELAAFLAGYSSLPASQGVKASSLGGVAIGIGIGLTAVTAGYLTYAGLKGANDVMWPSLNQSTTKPSEIGLVAEEIVLDADIKGLKGWYIPAARPTTKAIVFQHGHGGNKSQFLAEFVPWLRQDYNIVTFDFRGCGESPKAPSSLGYFEAQEVTAAIALAKARGNTSIGLMGFSMGAAASLIAGAQDPSIKAIVEDCSFSDWYHAFHPRIVTKKYPLPAAVAVAIEKTLELKLGINAAGAQPVKFMPRWAGRPVYIIHGDADAATTPDNAHLLYAATAEPRTMWLAPGAGHADSHKVHPQEYERRVLDFFKAAL
ncbi:MAG: alpha/beta fold hydrolase [Candidatus Sericytochromatia bacterium]|nr:alpha/beta fold hydrolase [Candidatus Tanganyikabacteria bacterium]